MNISEMSKCPSAVTNMRVWNIVLHSIKTIIKHNINGEKNNKKVRYDGGFDDFMVILIFVFVLAIITLLIFLSMG